MLEKFVRLFGLAALWALAACGSPAHAPAATAAAGETRYEIVIDQTDMGFLDLAINGRFPPSTAAELSVTEGAEPFVKNVEVARADGGSWRKIERVNGSWFADECAAGCSVRYHFDLENAGDEIDEDDVAMTAHHIVEAPPPAWLIRPMQIDVDARVRLHVTSKVKGVGMATGVRRAASGEADTYEITAGDLRVAPYTVFGQFAMRSIDAGNGAHFQFAVAAGKMDFSDAVIDEWIRRSALAVTAFYGRFPIDGALIVALPSRGDDVGFGRTMAGGGASILINVGRSTTEAQFAGDWVAVHEMIHLAFPSMGREHAWIEEGLATYLEPLVRVRAGMTEEKNVWEEFLTMIQNGLPQPGDRGLDRTRTWGRTYWGGALFCLLADLDIRERTHNTKSLDDAMRGILNHGGDDSARWTMERAFDEGDKATGVPVLRELYAKMAFAPLPVDLDAIWKKLGVSLHGREVVCDDTAPLADIRKSLTARRP